MGHLRFNVRFASLGIKCIHRTHLTTNLNRHRLLVQVRAIKQILSVWDAFNLIAYIGAGSRPFSCIAPFTLFQGIQHDAEVVRVHISQS